MRVVFAGTPDFARQALQAIVSADFEIPLVLTQPDRPAGRGMKATASPVKEFAVKQGIKVYQPPTLRSAEALEPLHAVKPDVMVVAAYGLILPPDVLNLPRLGCLNIHASLLPRWRGAAPIQRAIMAGDAETGITIMQMDQGLDTGAMLHKASERIRSDDTASSLHDRLAVLGAKSIVEVLERLKTTPIQGIPQDDEAATYAAKLSKAESPIDWARSATEIERQVRAFNPFPVAQTQWGETTLRIWSASVDDSGTVAPPGTVLGTGGGALHVACGEGVLRIAEVQKAGGKRLSMPQFLAGHDILPGTRLGS